MRWKLFQLSVVFLVMASNIHWQWTPNIVVAGVNAVFAAMGATWLLLKLIDWRRQTRGRKRRVRQQKAL